MGGGEKEGKEGSNGGVKWCAAPSCDLKQKYNHKSGVFQIPIPPCQRSRARSENSAAFDDLGINRDIRQSEHI